MVPKSHSKTGPKNDRFLVDFGVPLGTLLEPKVDQKSIIFQVGVPEGPRGSPGVDFGRIFDQCWTYFGMIFCRFLDVHQCSDSICLKCLL